MFNRNLKPESYLYFACQLWVLSLFVVAVFPFSVFLIKLSQIRMQRGKINHYEFQKSWRDKSYSLDWTEHAAWCMNGNAILRISKA